MKKLASNLQIIVLASVLSAALLFGMVFNVLGYSLQQLATAIEEDSDKIAITSKPKLSANGVTVQISSKEISPGLYRWTNSTTGTFNPTLKVIANATNIIKIENPTDSKHNLIIDTGTDFLPESGAIAPRTSGQLSFGPTSASTYTYHCAYHPFTMNGKVIIVNK